MILNNYFIKRNVEKQATVAVGRKHCFRSLKEAHNILIFFEAKDEDKIEPCLETLRMLKKNVQVCLYVSRKNPLEANDSYQMIYENKDINRWGFPLAEISRQVNDIKADVLIDLTGDGCYSMKYIMLQHPSCFKVGLKRKEQDMYDFSLSVTDRDDLMYLFGQIIFYLQTIRSK
ncbi:hypothetical protein D0T51_02925 [Parabacteroides sp. 52]|uniref:DUF6913 domain-containing protein n=1 Tax=unclassified Parabacteroides TaxID=2649774 RepID=UPI0013CFE808|nr:MULTISPECIES: glycosyltransferase family 9 protein [unclassified Parabacteroides]MDH6533943.1 hypothetical protein [Parabacteroides sp. PM5-20]NDV54687.1 hypothetical protein [Parabacteroides sp. 52]